ncbi:hypothetical protein NC653_030139 [Populus alba x Populus x berolinensis]|uniref:Uncharacterized protein n=1 Tax=Populus alba x Populus x berolinensis TaxID=444605 RepID=A0AAD6LVM9_9ROSI|nr:hypothetical protein NC653_030139 [Populus alba x Populus x berolinensis]
MRRLHEKTGEEKSSQFMILFGGQKLLDTRSKDITEYKWQYIYMCVCVSSPAKLAGNDYIRYMESSETQLDLVQNGSGYDIEKEIKAFDESKAGVKGLVDSGIVKIPPFFVVPENVVSSQPTPAHLQIPVIDLKDIRDDPVRHEKVIEEIRSALEIWGFFQEYYTRDVKKKVTYTSNTLIHKTKAADWKDTLYFRMAPDSPRPEELPVVCRETTIKYSAYIRGLGDTLLKLVSEALGLNPNYLIEFGCAKGSRLCAITIHRALNPTELWEASRILILTS